MLQNRLNILLAERNLTASKVFDDTHISKSTLSSLVNNSGDGIQFKTLDKLCNYLDISPNEFFDYAPYIYKFHTNRENDIEFIIEVESANSLKTYWYYVSYNINEDYREEETRLEKYDFYVSVYCSSNIDPFLEDVYNKLSISLKSELKTRFFDFILDEVAKDVNTGTLKERHTNKLISKDKEMKTLFRTPLETFVKTYDPMTEMFI